MKPDQIILALDVDTSEEALSWAKRFRGKIGTFKIGLQLYLRSGVEVLSGLQKLEVPIFLDLKFHDIPNTVGQAVRAVAPWKPRFLTVHASGGEEMMAAAVSHAAKETHVLGVTLLTSLSEEAVRAVGWHSGVDGAVRNLSTLAKKPVWQVLFVAPMKQRARGWSGVRRVKSSPQESDPREVRRTTKPAPKHRGKLCWMVPAVLSWDAPS